MKDDIHPPYQDVLFVDTSTGKRFVCGSTLRPKDTEVYEGREYPVYPITVSSDSHPFFTGSNKFVDTEGRIDKFLKKYAAKPPQPKKEEPIAVEKPTAKKKKK